jgi:hypothetical protein
MEPRFSELNKVRVICDRLGNDEGYVIAAQFKDGRWIYKISISEHPKSSETIDNWVPEECLELTRKGLSADTNQPCEKFVAPIVNPAGHRKPFASCLPANSIPFQAS